MVGMIRLKNKIIIHKRASMLKASEVYLIVFREKFKYEANNTYNL